VKSPNLGGTPIAKPGILILYAHWDDLGTIGTGSSATAVHPEGPTVTVSTDGEYEWYAGVSYSRQDFWFSQVVSEVVENPDPPPPYIVKIPATVDIDPNTLNLRSEGQWITAYIQLPEGYDAADIDASTILLNETISPVLDPKYDFVTNSSEYLVDHNEDGILERMIKFDRAAVESFIYDHGITYGEVSLTITGELFDGTAFEGTDIISVNYAGDANNDGMIDIFDIGMLSVNWEQTTPP